MPLCICGVPQQIGSSEFFDGPDERHSLTKLKKRKEHYPQITPTTKISAQKVGLNSPGQNRRNRRNLWMIPFRYYTALERAKTRIPDAYRPYFGR